MKYVKNALYKINLKNPRYMKLTKKALYEVNKKTHYMNSI